jgi:transcriptional regulator with XRE-family HTH domain
VIRNERQYRVTQAERDKLASELRRSPSADAPDWVVRASREALASQVIQMDEALADYDALRLGTVSPIAEVRNLSELPRALIRARIAGNLTQRELAERLSLREQQIQRYEATDYAGASIARLSDVMAALDVSFAGELTLPIEGGDATTVRRALASLGIADQTVSRRFFASGGGTSSAKGWMNAASRAARIFQTSVADLLSGNLAVPANAGAFRASVAANRDRVNGYARYAEYLARQLALSCKVEYRHLPDAAQLREELGEELVRRPLEALLEVCWSHGVPVLPLADPGAFYGACWHIDGRPVIVLKHGLRSPDRWAFLLAHEMDHARHPSDVPVLEADIDAREWRAQPEEIAADAFAADVLLGEMAEAMVHVAVDRAAGDVARLKSVVPDVATAGGVSVGILADHVAFRVGSPGVNWWATANRLHPTDQDAWRITRSALFNYVDLSRLDPLDRDILVDGISP